MKQFISGFQDAQLTLWLWALVMVGRLRTEVLWAVLDHQQCQKNRGEHSVVWEVAKEIEEAIA